MNKGREVSRTDIIAFTDDDSRPLPDWLEKIENHFAARPEIVGLGGRDIQFYGGKIVENWPVTTVGQVLWFGRTIGNHHLDFKGTTFVDMLKGVNMAFRNDVIRDLPFDVRLRGAGAQVHFELMFCLTLRKRGGKLFFDAETAVNHYPAARHDNDVTTRGGYDSNAFENYCFNESLCLQEYLRPGPRLVYRVWSELIGTRVNFGLLQVLRFIPKERARAIEKYRISRRARRDALREARRSPSSLA
jgi:glycosyltransferase involved in cell wall biosynthesis